MKQIDFSNNEFLEAPPIVNTSEPHMACLFLVDTSGSMGMNINGVIPINELNNALNRFKEEVCRDSRTRDILDIAIIEFNNSTKVVQDFRPIEYMKPVELIARGQTYLLPAIREAVSKINERSRFYRRMGTEPYKPWIVLISDGEPFDSVEEMSAEISPMVDTGKLAFWALSVPGANNEVLHKLAGQRVLNLKDYDFSGFFNWVNKSMRAVSQSSPGEKVKGQELPSTITIDDLM